MLSHQRTDSTERGILDPAVRRVRVMGARRGAQSADRKAFLNYKRFISVAAYAAPKPLSIFTTVTLLAQLLSMPNSAASP